MPIHFPVSPPHPPRPPIKPVSYVIASGDEDYNFGHGDFTVEFFMEAPNTSLPCQTLFEICSANIAASNLYSRTRFLTVLESGNINSYALNTVLFYLEEGIQSFSSPIPFYNGNTKLFVEGQLLESSQYNVTSNSYITLSAAPAITSLVEIGSVLFQILGGEVTANTTHFISTERKDGLFYLFLDGIQQSTPVSSWNSIGS